MFLLFLRKCKAIALEENVGFVNSYCTGRCTCVVDRRYHLAKLQRTCNPDPNDSWIVSCYEI